jgi:hypothetical protein
LIGPLIVFQLARHLPTFAKMMMRLFVEQGVDATSFTTARTLSGLIRLTVAGRATNYNPRNLCARLIRTLSRLKKLPLAASQRRTYNGGEKKDQAMVWQIDFLSP